MKVKSAKTSIDSVTIGNADLLKRFCIALPVIMGLLTAPEFFEVTKDNANFNKARKYGSYVLVLLTGLGVIPASSIKKERIKQGNVSTAKGRPGPDTAYTSFTAEDVDEEEFMRAAVAAYQAGKTGLLNAKDALEDIRPPVLIAGAVENVTDAVEDVVEDVKKRTAVSLIRKFF